MDARGLVGSKRSPGGPERLMVKDRVPAVRKRVGVAGLLFVLRRGPRRQGDAVRRTVTDLLQSGGGVFPTKAVLAGLDVASIELLGVRSWQLARGRLRDCGRAPS